MRVFLLYGTETGNAEMLADDIAEVLGEAECETVVLNMDEVDVDDLASEQFVVVVCSTYGEGELPESAQPFHDALLERRPDLRGLRFATFGLGDSAYDTYNKGSQIIAKTLAELGAVEVGERGHHDASSGLFSGDLAKVWAKSLASRV